MSAVAKFHALASLPTQTDQQRKALAEAVNLELSLPGMFLDMAGGKAANDARVTVTSAAGARPALPNLDAVKSALRVKYPTATDTPQSANVAARIDQWFHTGLAEIDMAWTNLFRLVDMRGGNQDAFEIYTGEFPVQFKQRAPGEKIEIARVPAETELQVKYVKYGAGIGIQDEWLRYNKWWTVADVTLGFRTQAWDQKAANHYGLFTGLGSGINFNHIADDTFGTETLNAAAASIYRAQQGKGTAVSASTPLWIVTSPEKVGYISRMLEVTRGSLIAGYHGGEPLIAQIAGVIATSHVAANDAGYYLVLPGRKIARGVWQDLQIEENRDIYKQADDMVGTEQYNAIVADTTQVRRVLFG